MKRSIWLASAVAVVISGCAHGAPVVPSVGVGPAAGQRLALQPDAGVVAKNFVAAYLDPNIFDQGTGGPIVTGPDGNLYVLGASPPSLLQINPDGVQTKIYNQTLITDYRSLDSGINDKIWFGGGSLLN